MGFYEFMTILLYFEIYFEPPAFKMLINLLCKFHCSKAFREAKNKINK